MKQKNILVVVDAQVDFCTGTLGTEEAQASLPNIENKIIECGKTGYHIYTTMDTHNENYLNTNEGKHLPVPHTIGGTPGHDLVESVKWALSKCTDVEKVQKHTFGSPTLADCILIDLPKEFKHEMGTEGKGMNIVLIGWCTDICVIANAVLLKTAFPEANITVDSNCCAGVTPEAHEAALTVMRSLQINVI